MNDERGFSLKEMVTDLRNWRHDKAVPMLAAHEALLKVLERDLKEITEELLPALRLVTAKLDRADQVAAEIRKEKDRGFSRRQKLIAGAVGLCALGLQAVSVVVLLTSQ